ncbi:MAG: trehalose-phosphatase [Candidatus Paceibacterota bacterium]
MKYVFKNIYHIKKKLKTSTPVLFLDFDLTLSPLAKNPTKAFLPKETKVLLRKLVKHVPITIVTGRKLTDIQKRVGIKGIPYVGNHGLEHNLNGKYKNSRITTPMRKAIQKIKKELIENVKKYPGIVFEDKKYSIALGYRMVKQKQVLSLKSWFKGMEVKIQKEGLLEVRLDNKTFEVRPKTKINKGTACLQALRILKKKLQKNIVPIYIGDSETDEDAFKSLRRGGITIRVGKNKTSRAEWYLQNQKEVNPFLNLLEVMR